MMMQKYMHRCACTNNPGLNLEHYLSTILAESKPSILSLPIPDNRRVVRHSSKAKLTWSVAFITLSKRWTIACHNINIRSMSDTLTFYESDLVSRNTNGTFEISQESADETLSCCAIQQGTRVELILVQHKAPSANHM